MRAYINDPDWPNRKLDGYGERTETGTVPGALSDYTVELDQRIVPNGTLTVTVDGDALTVVPWAVAPTAGQAAVSYELPLVKCHSSREGASIEVTYDAGGGVLSSARRAETVPPVQSVNGKTGAVVLDGGDVLSGVYPASIDDVLTDLYSAKQDMDTDLTALANISGVGFISRIASGAVAPRVLIAGVGITVTNGGGISGNPSVALRQTGLKSTSSGVNAISPTDNFIQINLNSGNTTIDLSSASLPIGFSVWASIINNSATNQLTFDAGSGGNIHATGVFSQIWAMSTTLNVAHRWFKIVKIAASVWSIDTGAPS